MDKKLKQHRHNKPTRDDLDEVTPPGASFNTEAGRAAQGMRPDIGAGGGDTVAPSTENDEAETHEMEGAVGSADADSGGGAATGLPDADTAERTEGRVNKGNVEEDREKLFPDSKPKRESNE